MSGKEKEKGNELECHQEDGESYRKPGRKRTRRELVTQKAKDVQFAGGKPDYSKVPPEECYYEDGVEYPVILGFHAMTSREIDEYNEKVAESEGYDVEVKSTNYFTCGGIHRVIMNDVYRKLLNEMATLALVEYNKAQGTRLELKEVQKANKGYDCDGLKHYITFEVVDLDDRADPIKVFQAQVVSLFGDEGDRVDQIRPKPTAKQQTTA